VVRNDCVVQICPCQEDKEKSLLYQIKWGRACTEFFFDRVGHRDHDLSGDVGAELSHQEGSDFRARVMRRKNLAFFVGLCHYLRTAIEHNLFISHCGSVRVPQGWLG